MAVGDCRPLPDRIQLIEFGLEHLVLDPWVIDQEPLEAGFVHRTQRHIGDRLVGKPGFLGKQPAEKI